MTATRDQIDSALKAGRPLIDIITTGRESGHPRRIEIVFHRIDGRIYISGTPNPRKRSWLTNLEANPAFTFHLKGSVEADLPATARVIDDEAERRSILTHIAEKWNADVEIMVRQSPLIEVTIDS
ncbi:MAG TPA: nitroreductase family deazaflavin-dependent oxidoreductase [Candidatus Dormibacteraeota bacterium]|jgi:deazaflavin-dependent oxidoreductase (nitroreductase family)